MPTLRVALHLLRSIESNSLEFFKSNYPEAYDKLFSFFSSYAEEVAEEMYKKRKDSLEAEYQLKLAQLHKLADQLASGARYHQPVVKTKEEVEAGLTLVHMDAIEDDTEPTPKPTGKSGKNLMASLKQMKK